MLLLRAAPKALLSTGVAAIATFASPAVAKEIAGDDVDSLTNTLIGAVQVQGHAACIHGRCTCN